MPQPILVQSWTRPALCLTKRPAQAVLIAAIANEWTLVEGAMVGIVGNAFGRPYKEGEIFELATSSFPLSMAMASAETIRSRLSMMENTLGRLIKGTTLLPAWSALERDLRARSKERNRVVHANWGLSDEYPNDLIEVKAEGLPGYFKWSVRDFQGVADRVANCFRECIRFRQSLVDAMNGTDRVLQINHANMLGYVPSGN